MEGTRFVREALISGCAIEVVVLSTDLEPAVRSELAELARDAEVQCRLLEAEIFHSLSELVTPQGALALVGTPMNSLESLLGGDLLLLLDGIQDPGNAGTILRSAAAVGGVSVIFGPGCADPFSPKVVRASAGAVTAVPLVETGELSSVLERAKEMGSLVLGFEAGGDESIWEVALPPHVVVVIGSEGRGISEVVTTFVDTTVCIPMRGGVESLNASVAASLIMFEFLRRSEAG